MRVMLRGGSERCERCERGDEGDQRPCGSGAGERGPCPRDPAVELSRGKAVPVELRSGRSPELRGEGGEGRAGKDGGGKVISTNEDSKDALVSRPNVNCAPFPWQSPVVPTGQGEWA